MEEEEEEAMRRGGGVRADIAWSKIGSWDEWDKEERQLFER